MLLIKVSIENKDGYMGLCPEEPFTGATGGCLRDF